MNRLDLQTPGAAWRRPPAPKVGEVRFGDAFLWLIVTIPACFLLFTQQDTVPTISLISSVIVISSLALVARATYSNPTNLLFGVFVVVYILFHFGLLPVYYLDPSVLYTGPASWFVYGQSNYTESALKVAIVFLLGLTLAMFFIKPDLEYSRPEFTYPDEANTVLFLLGGLEVVWGAVVLIIGDVTNYIEYNEIFRGDEQGYLGGFLVFLYPTIAAAFLLGVSWCRNLKLVFLVFAPWALIAFLMGLRGMVLFPLAAAVPVLHAQGRIRVRWILVIVASWVLLGAVSFVRVFRSEGGLEESIEQTSVLAGFAELGNSLRPAYEVRRWLDRGFESFHWGDTYWAPFERIITFFLPIIDRPPAIEDLRLMNVAIVAYTQSNLGFSISAEAFVNFGYVGCLLIGLVVGSALLRIGRSVSRGHLTAFGGAVIYALFYHIRQSFVGAVATFFIFYFAALGIWALVARIASTSNLERFSGARASHDRTVADGGR